MEQPESSHNDWLYVLVYLCLCFGSVMLCLYADMALRMPHGMTITGIFAGPALIAWLFYQRLGKRGWQITALATGIVAAFVFTIALAADHILHPALLFALYGFGAAGMIFYFINRRRNADGRTLNARVEFDKLGTREKSPSERDVPRAA